MLVLYVLWAKVEAISMLYLDILGVVLTVCGIVTIFIGVGAVMFNYVRRYAYNGQHHRVATCDTVDIDLLHKEEKVEESE